MKKEKVLNKAQECLIKYSNSTSKYYNELKKNYNEYKSLDSIDPVTNDLYQKQILKLIRYVEEKEHFVSNCISLIIMSILIILLVSFVTIRIINTNEEVKVVIEKANSEVDLKVGENHDLFQFGYSSNEDVLNIDPIVVELESFSKDNYNMVYNVYLKKLDTNVNINNIRYSITVDDKTEIHDLKDCLMVLEKYQLFSGNMKLNTSKRLYIRFYTTDSNEVITHFNYEFDYDGYLE